MENTSIWRAFLNYSLESYITLGWEPLLKGKDQYS
jgi:hypothetical protein